MQNFLPVMKTCSSELNSQLKGAGYQGLLGRRWLADEKCETATKSRLSALFDQKCLWQNAKKSETVKNQHVPERQDLQFYCLELRWKSWRCTLDRTRTILISLRILYIYGTHAVAAGCAGPSDDIWAVWRHKWLYWTWGYERSLQVACSLTSDLCLFVWYSLWLGENHDGICLVKVYNIFYRIFLFILNFK